MSHQENLHKMHFCSKLAVILSELQLIFVISLQFVPENGPHSRKSDSGTVWPITLNWKKVGNNNKNGKFCRIQSRNSGDLGADNEFWVLVFAKNRKASVACVSPNYIKICAYVNVQIHTIYCLKWNWHTFCIAWGRSVLRGTFCRTANNMLVARQVTTPPVLRCLAELSSALKKHFL